MDDPRAKTDQWYSWPHSTRLDKKGRMYCRALNQVQELNPEYSGHCQYCPLWNRDCQTVHCQYYDFAQETEVRTPEEMKAYIDGLIQAGFTQEFPDFVTDPKWGLVEDAYQFAAMAHKGAKRKGTNIPYLTHLLEAAYYAFCMTDTPEVIAAAILHDVVEDTKYELKDIEERFGREVAELVGCESENKRPDIPPEESWQIRKEEFLKHLALAPTNAKIITLADKLSNIKSIQRDMEEMGDEVWNKFHQKDKKMHGWYYLTIAELTSELAQFETWKEYKSICEEVFSENI